MPSDPRDRLLNSPFLGSPPVTPWRTKADFHRRSPFVKRIACLAIIFAFAVPLWMLTHRTHDSLYVSDQPVAPAPVVHAQRPPAPHRHPVPNRPASPVNLPAVHDDSGLAVDVPHVDTPKETPKVTGVQKPSEEEPVTFSLIMWSRDSATEGVILIKVRARSMNFWTVYELLCSLF